MVDAFELRDVRRERVSRLLRERNSRFRTFPMSLQQRGIWFIQQLLTHTTAYLVPLAVPLPQRHDPEHVRRAVALVVAHHSSLRTTIDIDGLTFEPVQRVHATIAVPVPHTDLSALPPDEAEAAAAELSRREATTPVDLERGPLIRTRLLDLPADRQRLLLTLHHLIADGWSLHLLIQDLLAALAAVRHGRSPMLRRAPCSYHDWAAWQRARSADDWQPHLRFYRDLLRGAPPVLTLPTDRPRPATPTQAGDRHVWTLPPGTLSALHERARASGTTLYCVLLAALAVVLSRHSGQDRVVIGTPMANRTHPALQDVIGYFVTVGVLPVTVTAPRAALLNQVHRQLVDVLAHQELPFSMLVEELAPPRSLSVHPIFQVMLALQNTPDAWQTEQLQQPVSEAKFDLTFNAVETPDGLRVDCVYATDLFDHATVVRLCDEFTRELT
ncbi:condensation domain-containing protein [Solwaraspora sp. WMMD1047]|uniref:condensation domain-containing protein n=1 Tax=Solwaraspora sp. WMMD1047 TaxID=3016102 RepID=UPI002417F0F7|nr:condensation domain-containing protein [Solwaraspora sp. WMMD1047]MDG4834268.1 condensation domain-containing protein [Solwaraspora sp. WMMD1047]